MRTYSELIQLPTFKERFEYLKLDGQVGKDTFGFDRYLNQQFYRSKIWRDIKNKVIVRDNGCDMAHLEFPIPGRIYVHHMNPVDSDDILMQRDILLEPEFLVCVSQLTHNAIHYGDFDLLPSPPVNRSQNDTCPWKH